MMRFRRWHMAASAILAVQLGGAVAADTIKLAVLGPMSGPFALQYSSGVVKFRKVQIKPL